MSPDPENTVQLINPDDPATCPVCGVRADLDTHEDGTLRQVDSDDDGPIHLGICHEHGAFRFQFEEPGCDYCRNDGALIDGVCPDCDAEYGEDDL